MCDVCMHNPCLSGCPEAPDPEPVETCIRCGNGIFAGEEYGRIDGVCYCVTCLSDMPIYEMVLLAGGEVMIAGEVVPYE